jgi:hypothetical protein
MNTWRHHRMGRNRPGPAALGATALVTALLAAACSSASPGPQVASLGGHHAGGAGLPGLTAAQSDRDMVDFARCMRAHGVNMPDPVHIAGHSGLSLQLPPTPPPLANTACQHFLRPIVAAKMAGMAARMTPARLAALTRYARCMRAHDIDMLDPTSFGALNLGNVPGVNSDFGRYSPQFRAADTACRHLLPAGVHDNGTGP